MERSMDLTGIGLDGVKGNNLCLVERSRKPILIMNNSKHFDCAQCATKNVFKHPFLFYKIEKRIDVDNEFLARFVVKKHV